MITAVIMNIASFVAFSIALLAISDKASPSFVFRDVIDATGYVSLRTRENATPIPSPECS